MEYKIGDKVKHVNEGTGIVVNIDGEDIHVKLDSGKKGSGKDNSWNTDAYYLTPLIENKGFNCYKFWETHKEWCIANCQNTPDSNNCIVAQKKLEEENGTVEEQKFKVGDHVKITGSWGKNYGEGFVTYYDPKTTLYGVKLDDGTEGSGIDGAWTTSEDTLSLTPAPLKPDYHGFQLGETVQEIIGHKTGVLYNVQEDGTPELMIPNFPGSGKDGAWVCSWEYIKKVDQPTPSLTPAQEKSFSIVGRKVVQDGVQGRIIDKFVNLKPKEKIPTEYYYVSNGTPVIYNYFGRLRIWNSEFTSTDWKVGQFIPEKEWQEMMPIIQQACERLHKINHKES